MQTYANYAPTGFDRAGAFLPNSGDWLVVPVGRNRDSDCLAESNFETALEMLGGESDHVQVHRFGHWACGWFEIIIVEPDTVQAGIAEEIEAGLADYPVLSDEDHSNRQCEAYSEAWERWGWRDFADGLADKFGADMAWEAKCDLQEALREVPTERLQAAFEALIPSGEYYDHDGAPNVSYALERATQADLNALLGDAA